MKNLIALATLTAAMTANAQSIDWTKTTTPPIASVYEFSMASDGESYLLSGASLYEVRYSLPMNLSFNAGHGIVWGTKLSDVVNDATPVFGYGIYVSKNLASSGFSLRASAMILFDNTAQGKKATTALSIGMGYGF